MAAHNSTGNKPPTVRIDVGLAYELLLSITVFQEQDEYAYEIDRQWFETARMQAQPDLLDALSQFPSSYMLWHRLIGLVYDSAPPHDVPAFLAHLEEISSLDLRLYLLGYYERSARKNVPLDIIVQAAEGDEEAQQQYLQRQGSHLTRLHEEEQLAELHHIFSTEPDAMKTKLLFIIRQWYERVFRASEQQILPLLERDAATKKALQQTLSPERLIETATNGIMYVPEPGMRRVLLVPTFIGRPTNDIMQYHDITIFCYPIADEIVAESNQDPPTRLVRLYKALADEKRLRILKLLKLHSYSLQELADEFGVPKTTMHHHLITLRTAGLVLAHSDDKIYSLRPQTLSEVSTLLNAYLQGLP